ncbi:MAG TPA: flagellar protein FlaG [Gelria sp.]|nr:flagellar protein FlaG [Gelria sp.]
MRVEGQRMAVDFKVNYPNSESSKPQLENERPGVSREKIGVNDLKQRPVNGDELMKAAKVMNDLMKVSNYHLQFRVHEDSGRVQVKVIDSESKEVIREIPPEKLLECSAMIKSMLDKMAGILVDEII